MSEDQQDLSLDRFLHILEINKSTPKLENLNKIIKSFLTKIPFETISKLYYKNKYNLCTIPDLELYLDGIENSKFGGTCYSNNYYLNLLLKYLGYDVIMCGADMNDPDVHIVNIVKIDEHDYLVDVGYWAPFIEAIPFFLKEEQIVTNGNDNYFINLQKSNSNIRVDHYREDKRIHGYTARPINRTIEYFEKTIEQSYSGDSTFMNNILLTRFTDNGFIILRNLTLVITNKDKLNIKKIKSFGELPNVIENQFHISADITKNALTGLKSSPELWE